MGTEIPTRRSTRGHYLSGKGDVVITLRCSSEWYARYGYLTDEDHLIIGQVLAKIHHKADSVVDGVSWDKALKDYFLSGRGHEPPYKYGEARAVVTCQVRAMW